MTRSVAHPSSQGLIHHLMSMLRNSCGVLLLMRENRAIKL